MDTFISDGLTRERISPSTENLQREIRDVLSQAEERQADSLSTPSTGGGTQKLTIPGDPYQVAGSDQACRSVLVVHTSDNAVYMNISAVATADSFPIPKNVVLPIPIDNCDKLNFFGTTADTIRLLWRN